jgi:hypothetical protein
MPTSARRLPKRDRRVLHAAVIGMMHEESHCDGLRLHSAISPGHRLRALCPHVRVHRPPDNPSRMGVHDEGRVEKALSRRYVGDMPANQTLLGSAATKSPCKESLQSRSGAGAARRITASSSTTILTPHTASEPGGFHQPGYSPPTATDPKRAKLCVYSRIAVSPAAPTLWIWRIFSVRRASCRLLLSEGGLLRQE